MWIANGIVYVLAEAAILKAQLPGQAAQRGAQTDQVAEAILQRLAAIALHNGAVWAAPCVRKSGVAVRAVHSRGRSHGNGQQCAARAPS